MLAPGSEVEMAAFALHPSSAQLLVFRSAAASSRALSLAAAPVLVPSLVPSVLKEAVSKLHTRPGAARLASVTGYIAFELRRVPLPLASARPPPLAPMSPSAELRQLAMHFAALRRPAEASSEATEQSLTAAQVAVPPVQRLLWLPPSSLHLLPRTRRLGARDCHIPMLPQPRRVEASRSFLPGEPAAVAALEAVVKAVTHSNSEESTENPPLAETSPSLRGVAAFETKRTQRCFQSACQSLHCRADNSAHARSPCVLWDS
mmetsp:Transcript_52516/g.122906  ORF Transcript_52516/g.122906 Transcript_52516/m.122906 type:complete len:261 (-) Transcript_52516:388-1170(-)